MQNIQQAYLRFQQAPFRRGHNYPQSRVTDHRIGFTTKNLDRVMEGELDEIIEALITEDQKRKLAGE